MLLQNTSLPSLTIAASLPVVSKTWQVGQILQAIVQGRDQQGRLEIKIGNNTLTATSPKVYQVGQTLKLQVVDMGETLVLQNLEPGRTTTKKPLVEQLLRHALPKQGKLQTLVKSLNQLVPNLKVAAQDLPVLPKPLVKHLVDTQSVLPAREQVVNPQTLKQTIKDSGLFMEAKLAATLPQSDKAADIPPSSVVKTDLKAKLIGLIHVIEQSLQVKKENMTIAAKTPVQTNVKLFEQNPVQNSAQKNVQTSIESKTFDLLELRQIVESAIARIQVNQSQAIVTEERPTPVWIIDLPIMDEQLENMAELKIQYEDTQMQTQEPTRKWSVNLTLDIAPLGKIHVHLNLLGEELSSSIWAEQTLTNRLIKQNLPNLEKRLQQSGLNVIALKQHPMNQQDPIRTQQHSPLLSTKI
jgi:Flagellar hook-length control protein FliK